MSEIKRQNRRRVHQNISKAVTVDDGKTVRAKARYDTTGVLIETANIQRDFIVKDPDAPADYCAIVSERRPRKAGPRRQVLLFRNPLVFITHAEIETQVRT